MIDIKWVIALTLIFEFVTIFARFIFKMSSKHVYINIMKKYHLKHFVHIHHGITGILVFLLGIYTPINILLTIGLAMIFSDAIHHLIVLNYVVGNPEFHLLYKNAKFFEKEQKLENQKMDQFFGHLFHHV